MNRRRAMRAKGGAAGARRSASRRWDDGVLDLAVADNGTSSVYIMLGKGDGTFANPVPYAGGANGLFGHDRGPGWRR